MAKQKTTQQFVLKINSTLLAKNNWDLILPLERARKVPGLVVSLGDSQILTWINQLNGTTDYDIEAKRIKKEIKYLKKQPNCKENKKKIAELYKNLYDLPPEEEKSIPTVCASHGSGARTPSPGHQRRSRRRSAESAYRSTSDISSP